MRFYRLGFLPPGLYHDEAINGLDALRVLEGERPIFFEANNGREPLFVYGTALAISLLGRTPFAVRVTAAILGTLTVPATYLMARALFDERVGLWSAWLYAFAPWPVNLGRIGLRAVSLPLVLAVAVWLWWSGRSRQGWRRILRWSLGGALLGLSLYTYTAARFVLVVAVLFVLYQKWVSREQPYRWELPCVASAAVLAMVPMIAYGSTHPNAFVERLTQVSILSPEIHHGDPIGMLASNVLGAAGLFTFRGDSIPRHNVPLRPLFDPVLAVFFVLGVLLSLAKVRASGPHALALIWTGVMLVPTIMAEDCPHFLRAVGVLPIALVFPALGLEWASGQLQARSLGWASTVLIGIVLGIAAVWGVRDYLRHARDPELNYSFEADQVRGAVEINRFLGTGWQGEGILALAGEPTSGNRVYLAPRVWEDRFSINFLVGSPTEISILGRDPPVEADSVLALAWPHEDSSDVQRVLPGPAQIQVWPGPLERGDLDTEPRLLYVAYQGTALEDVSPALARFESGIELLGWEAEPEGEAGTRLRLRWRATRPISEDYTAFVHLVRDGQVVAQSDSAPAAGFYPTTWWKPGDEIVDEHVIDAPYDPRREEIVIGWYDLASMQHLRVLGEDGQLGSDRFALQ
jgi:4-amino-4-deoxy-L-arabinose transferase-like glycosyltransferase